MSGKKQHKVAIAYDFDNTLAPGNMQEHSFIPDIGMEKEDFWAQAGQDAKDNNGDVILAYLNLMLSKAKEKNVSIKRAAFVHRGKDIPLFDGVEQWFERVNAYGKERQLDIQHYIISSGLREMVEGTSISKNFKRIFASSFAYNVDGIASAVAMAVNYTTKTQFLFRINKDTLDVWDDNSINEYVLPDDRAVPFERMIYVGDGPTDVPCMRLVKDMGGHSIAVYKKHTRGAKLEVEKLLENGRINFIALADYRENSEIEKQVFAVLDWIAANIRLERLGRRR